MRQDPPAGELGRITGLPRVEKHKSYGEVLRQPDSWLQGKMHLIVSGQQSPIVSGTALRIEIPVSFEAILAARQRFVFVDVYLERILRGDFGCATKQTC